MAKKILTNEKRRAASPTLSSQEWNPRLRRAILGHRKIEKKQNPSVVKQIIPVETPAKLLPLPSLKAVKTFAKKTLKAPLILTQPVPSSVLPAAVGLDTPSEIFIDRYDIPATYHKTWIALMAKDPYALYATWETSPSEANAHSGKVVLRVYDVTSIHFDGTNANHFFDMDVGAADNWYIPTWTDHRSFCTEIGVRTSEGTFIPRARSNFVHTPRAGASWRTEEIWMEVREEAAPAVFVFPQKEEYPGRGTGPRSYSPLRRRRIYYLTDDDIRRYYAQLMPLLANILLARSAKLRPMSRGYRLTLGELRSFSAKWRPYPGKLFLGASENTVLLAEDVGASASLQTPEKKRKFFFELAADVTVYGRTEPDAEVFLYDKKIDLRPDGTFSVKFSLPDGNIPLEFTAVANDRLEKRSITTQIGRETQYPAPVMLEGKI